MNSPLISIIMAAYNAENYIAETINTVINQTFTDWELIIVDDWSKDKTKEVIDSFKDPRIRLIVSKQNGGPGVARNVGVENSKGKFIAFLDTDDLWLPKKLEKQLHFMIQRNAPISHTNYSFINEAGETISGFIQVSPVVDQNSYMKNTEIGMSSSMINRELVKEIKFSPMRDREDTRLWIELLGKNLKSYGLSETLMQYRIRKGQVSGNKFKSAYRTLKLYLSITNIPTHQRVINFCYYFINGIIKRI